MKTGRNDLCPCGSGKKYKHCCLNNPKVIPFTGNPHISKLDGNNNVNMTELPPVHQMMGFDSKIDYEEALADYTNFCENTLKDNETAPSFREYYFGSGPAGEIFGDSNFQKELAGAKNIEEAKTIAEKNINNYNASLDETPYIPIEKIIRELIIKGPLKAKNAVLINKKNISVEDLRKTPIIQLSIAFLEYLARSNGGIAIPERKSRKFNLESVIDILREQSDIKLISRDSRGKPVISYWYDLVNIMLTEKGYISYSKSIINLTDKGLKLLNNKGVKATYFQFLTFITEGINWFYDSDFHEEVEEFQNFAGFSLLIMNRLSDNNHFISAEDILKTVDTMYHILDDLEKVHIDNKKAFEIFDDYFLNGYCCLMGFTDRDSISGYEPTELFFELFEWLI